MRPHVGLGIAHDAVRAVAVTGQAVRWAAQALIVDGHGLEQTITRLLAEAPLRRWPRPVLFAAVGSHASQTKVVTGLPEVRDPKTLAAVIREAAGSFFLKNGVPLVTTGVRVVHAGAAWAAALDLPAVEAVREACRTLGWQLGAIAPSAVALPRAVQDPAFSWAEGTKVLEIIHAGGTLTSVRTRPAWAPGTDVPAHPVPPLAEMGPPAHGYLDAYGAAMLDPAEPLVLDRDAAGWWTRPEVMKQIRLPAVVLLVGIASAALSPMAARWAEARAQAEVDQLRPDQWAAIDSAQAGLSWVTRILTEASASAAPRVSLTILLSDVARVLPDLSAITSFELDGDDAQLLILTREPAAVLSIAGTLPGLVAADVVTNERNGEVVADGFERVLLRFHLRRSVDSTIGRAR